MFRRRRTPPSANPDPSLALDVARERLQFALTDVDSVDAKLGIVFAGGSGVAAIAAGVVALRPGEWSHGGARALFLVGAVYFALAAVTLIGMWPQTWDLGPHGDKFAGLAYEGKEAADLPWKAIDRYLEDAYWTRQKVNGKVRLLKWGLGLLAFQTSLFGIIVAVLL
jgi:hypothetical protein